MEASPKKAAPLVKKTLPAASNNSFPVVGIGASAGGLEAFTQLLGHLPVNTGMAFVLIQHLDPAHPSVLAELLARKTQMPVSEVTDGAPVKADPIYVIPPNKSMIISHGALRLIPRPQTPGPHLPIDHFLSSLAEDRKSKAIGVILSGTASDGTLGLKAIKAEGGITFAQDEQSAKHHDMPRNAIGAGGVDFILPPSGIARELARISRHPYVAERPVAATREAPAEDQKVLNRIFLLLLSSHGVDFTHYSNKTIERRLQRRMALHKTATLENYFAYLEGHAAEVKALYEDILIHVTSFFRDPKVFQTCKDKVLATIVKNRSPGSAIRIWVPGCSTGEEVYTLAICLLESLGEGAGNVPIQMFATDINETALDKARAGVYAEGIAAQVSPERLRRFFVKVDGGYQISRMIRNLCVFAKHNVADDPPFSKLNLISCRNVLIYLGPVLQKTVISIFHYALEPKGFLLLGSSESVGRLAELFKTVESKCSIYTKKVAAGRPRMAFRARTYGANLANLARIGPSAGEERPGAPDVQREADRLVMAEFAPPGVLINEDMQILQFRGATGPYLEHVPGKASLDVLKTIRKELLFGLRTAVHKATKGNGPVKTAAVRVKHNGQDRDVKIEVIPIGSKSSERHFLVLFEEVVSPPALKSKPAEPGRGGKERRADDSELRRLRRELAEATEYQRSVIEERESVNEELTVANEELQSTNEELQSTNEELQSAEEELQASNEELHTMNEELQHRNAELERLYSEVKRSRDYAEEIVETVREPLLVLDENLRVTRANRAFYKTFRVAGEMKSQFIYDLGGGAWNIPALRTLLSHVLPEHSTLEDYRLEHIFPVVGRKTMLLNAREIRLEADDSRTILLAIEDISAEEIIRRQQEAIMDLSTPVLRIRERLLILPIIGAIDSARLHQLSERLLLAIRTQRARVVVLDFTGLASLDAAIASHLVRLLDSARLLGSDTIMTGLSREITRTLSDSGLDLGRITTAGDLQSGIEIAERLLGYRVIKAPA